ncbi:MAG TPA: F0F1 ATP synthase subunit epsilon [Candidatus Dormibacteraeota bacterium]|jgi:F-type H+-transporting ATPase subunit epsilon|nr:F0F1 ATP synthase subunit epsilon [Candidatus Dormibacteraeota bacterium]
MAKLHVELVTAEGRVLSQEADFVRAPGLGGELGVLPHHIPLMTPLRTGEVLVRNDNREEFLFVAGGFLEVLPDKVVILADAAERAEDIDEARAEESRRKAQQIMEQRPTDVDVAEAAAALERALHRLRIAEVRRRHRPRGDRPGAPPPQP